MLGKQGVVAPRSTARYDVRGTIGGAVYRARIVDSQHEVALKALPTLDPQSARVVRQRFEVVARARHPNLVALYDLEVGETSAFYAMELVDGVNVMAWVSRERPNDGDTVPSSPRRLRADLERLRPVMRQLADGLAALHDAGLRHDNLKPNNVLVTPQGRVVITDFGMTDDAAQYNTFDNPVSSSGMYISPEQSGAGVLTPASDWYALGVMLYEALTGRVPFAANRLALVSQDPAPPSELVDGIPPEIDALCMRLLDRDPAQRAGGQDVLATFEESTQTDERPPAPLPTKLELASTERFEVIRQLGRGGMGIVYEALDKERGVRVALKTLLRVDPGAIYRFKQEFRALSDVAHPNLISLYELVSTEGNYFFTMELLNGVDFVSYVRGRSGPEQDSGKSADQGTRSISASASSQEWSAEEATAVLTTKPAGSKPVQAAHPPADQAPINWNRLRDALLQLAHGVHALHASGHMHRDIKPSNVFVQPDGRVVLLDFGVIAELGAVRKGHQEMVGTPAYMAPEQARGKVTTASDWYAVGVVLYRVLTGALPYVGTMGEILFAKQDSDPVRPDTVRSDLPRDLVELCMQLLDRDPDRRPTGEEVLSRLGATRNSRSLDVNITARRRNSFQGDARRGLAGRDFHLMELRDAFAKIKRGAGQTVFVHGSSGMGKSALIDQFLDEVRAGSGVVLAGRCYEREQVPYKGVDAAIDALSRYLLQLDDAEVAALAPRDRMPLAQIFPVLESVPAFARADDKKKQATPEPLELRRRAFAALRTLLTNIGQRGPLVVFIDDVQWGDRDSAPLLADLMRAPNVPPMLLLLSYRTDDAARSPLLTTLLASGSLLTPREIQVGPLSEDEARALAYDLLASEGVDTDAAWTIARESRGHPYFIHELARYVKDEGLQEGVALSLDMVIGKRVQRLPAQARRVMEVVAVAGQPIGHALIGRATGLEPQERIPVMNQLRVAQLIRTTGGGDDQSAECYHDRIRELLVSLLPAEQLAFDHGRIAEAMLADPDPDPEALALHFQRAGDPQRAFAYATKAADRAATALAFDRAATLYRLALELPSDPDTRRTLNERLADALRNAGRGPEAAAAFFAAAEGASFERRLLNQRFAAEQLLYSGQFEEGMRAIAEVLRAVKLAMPATPTRALLSLLWRRFKLRLRGLKYKPKLLGEIAPDKIQLIDTCYGIGTSLAIVDVVRAYDFQVLNLTLALDAGEPYRISRGFAMEAGFISSMGHKMAPRVHHLLDEAMQLAKQIGNPQAEALALLTSGVASYEMGQMREAREYCDGAEEMLRTQCSGVAWELATARLFGTWAHYRLGRIAYLVERLPELERETSERGDLYGWLAIVLGCPRVAMTLATDDPAAQHKIADDAIARWPGVGYQVQHFWSDYSLIQIELYAGQADVAWARLTRVWPLLKKAMLMRVEEVVIHMTELRGRVALGLLVQTGDKKYATEVERAAKKLAMYSKISWCGAHAQLLRAQLAALRDDRQAEAALLAEAARNYATGGFAPYELAVAIGARHPDALERATAWSRREGVRNVVAMMRMLAPVYATYTRLDGQNR